MNVYIDLPYEDELLYSLCGRYLDEFSVGNRSAIIKDLFGTRLLLSPYFPRAIADFAARTAFSLGMEKEKVWSHLTMYPFLCAYISEQKCEEVKEASFSGRVISKIPALLSGISLPLYLQWCPDCVLLDRREHGETYWHREHQLPAVWQCNKHSVCLVASAVPHFAVDEKGRFASADILIPKDVGAHRVMATGSVAEHRLRENLIGLLKGERLTLRKIRPNLKGAAILAGFGSSDGVDYRGLYESFSEFWSDVIIRLNESNSRIISFGWLHSCLNRNVPIWNPIVRELFGIYFFVVHNVDVESIPIVDSVIEQKHKMIFYCPNPYADHGPTDIVRRVQKHPTNEDLVFLKCDCGFYATVPRSAENKEIALCQVTHITRYGETWKKRFEILRAQGKSNEEISIRMDVSLATLCYWGESNGATGRMSHKELLAARRQWSALLMDISPAPPHVAMEKQQALHRRLLRGDASWLERSIREYRVKHHLRIRKKVDWTGRDKEYKSRVLTAARRLKELLKGRRDLSVAEILREAQINPNQICRNGSKLPTTVAKLKRLTQLRVK